MNKSEVLERIHRDWLVLILRDDSVRRAIDTFEALIAGGATLVEVPFTTAGACQIIEHLCRRHGERVLVSAGTVTTAEQVRQALASGARVIVSPHLDPAVVEATVKVGAVSAPGCFTPSEIAHALRLGADVIKIFPCNMLGPQFLMYIQGPFPGTRLMPAGSVDLENMRAYYDQGAFAGVVGVTVEMRLAEAVRDGRFDEITACARRWVEAVGRMKCRTTAAGRAGP